MSVAVPVDVTELVVRALRRLLSGRPESVAAGVKVSTETGRGVNGGPPSLPWLLVAEDGHTWAWPAVQRVVIRLTCWHRTPHSSKALAGLALGLLCHPALSQPWTAEPVTGPISATDPYTDKPLATATVAVLARTPPRYA
ncbi:hypothetical protein JOF56_000875 [Kibdelosporangium banguiense]|uniref:Uncharacterized protein n=1 Tax=Kibdelosporangium banguiense TaxID=1365924 RepID=A0ABS4T7V0_9PSEU|nr:hypothetical protein [Kibdelosporangium banguiense]MBP2320490.1 hypothetical protein [Kibdelosporangium banguiense]